MLDVVINNFLDGRAACYLAYSVPSNTLYLVNDAGKAEGPYAGALTLGSSGAIQNSQCAVSLLLATGSGTTLTLVLSIAFSASFGGNKVIYMAARDQLEDSSNWQALGVWQAPFPPTGTIAVRGLAQPRVTGRTSQLILTVTDTRGTGGLGVVNVLINNFLDGRQGCYLAYAAQSGMLYLVDDQGDAGGPFAGGMALNGGSGAVQNSQCAVSAGSPPALSGNTLTLTLNIAFTASFAGNRVVYAAARDGAGANNTDWQAVGTWTVQ